MIPVSRLAGRLRLALGDPQAVKVSDFELVEALNGAVETLFGRMGQRRVHWSVRTAVVVTDEDGFAVLPGDCHTVRRVRDEEGNDLAAGEYQALGGTFRAGKSRAYSVRYQYLPERVYSLTDVLDAAPALERWVLGVALALARGDLEGAEAMAERCCNETAGGDVSRFADEGPVTWMGGKLP